MPRQAINIPSRTYQPGTRDVDFPDLAGDEVGVRIRLTRESWPVGAVLSVEFFGSDDGGQTWRTIASGAWQGGVRLTRSGAIATEEVFPVKWPTLLNGVIPSRPTDVRVTATNNLAIQTAITVEGY